MLISNPSIVERTSSFPGWAFSGVDCQTQSVTCHAVTTAFQMINSAGRNSAFKDLEWLVYSPKELRQQVLGLIQRKHHFECRQALEFPR
jgi:hypothetical protein